MEIKSLRNVLKNNFTIIFYPTFDKFLKYEKKSRTYGVISKENFKLMENIYLDLLKIIENNNIQNIKIVLFNKKSLNWPINNHCVDLRNFENYNLNFPNILGLLNDNCNWTIGSEGTIAYSLVMCSKLKHALLLLSLQKPVVNLIKKIGANHTFLLLTLKMVLNMKSLLKQASILKKTKMLFLTLMEREQNYFLLMTGPGLRAQKLTDF